MDLRAAKEKVSWASQISGGVFLVVSTYIRHQIVVVVSPDEAAFASSLLWLAFAAALCTFVCGLLVLPRWQGFAALAIAAYAAHWLTQSPYAIGCN